MIQLTIMKITGYGPWTVTLGSDREHRLQMLQASMYGKVQELFSARNSLVFLNRADEFFAVTNGLDLQDHIDIQVELESQFDVRLSMSVGRAASPFEANIQAHRARSKKPLNESHSIYGSLNGGADDMVTIMHLDVENLTSRAETISPYEISSIIFDLYARMSEFFQKRGALSFFMGGDNFMVVADAQARDAVAEFLADRSRSGMVINCGIGTGRTARQAAGLATASLDTIRSMRDSGQKKPEIYETRCS